MSVALVFAKENDSALLTDKQAPISLDLPTFLCFVFTVSTPSYCRTACPDALIAECGDALFYLLGLFLKVVTDSIEGDTCLARTFRTAACIAGFLQVQSPQDRKRGC